MPAIAGIVVLRRGPRLKISNADAWSRLVFNPHTVQWCFLSHNFLGTGAPHEHCWDVAHQPSKTHLDVGPEKGDPAHAIATAMVHGPVQGLQLLTALDADPQLAGHYRLAAVRAHLLEKMGDYEGAIKHYRVAARQTTSIPEQNYLMAQAARLAGQ